MARTRIVTLALLLLIGACGDDAGGLPLGDTSTTTLAADTTTTVPVDTTTTAAPTTTAPTTTTEVTLPPPPLPQVRFLDDGIGFAAFGDDPFAVIGTADILWGPAITDTGLVASDFVCPGDNVRRITWDTGGGTIQLLFSDAAPFAGPGNVRFTGYGYRSPGGVPLTAGLPDSIDVGMTIPEVLSLWPAATVQTSEFTNEPMFLHTPGFATGILIAGRITGPVGAETVVDVWGGRNCLGDEPGGD